MTDKILVLILDALDEFNIYQLNLENIQQLYEERGSIFTCSTLPHTAVSNPMIFGGVENRSKFWVDKEKDEDGYVDPSRYFDRGKGEPVKGAKGFSREKDYENESFIWDDLYENGIDARAVQVPIVLPPYSFRATETLEEAWFPDNKERMAEHIREKPEILRKQFEDGADAVFSSIQMPDKWLHGIGEGKCTEEWVRSEAPVLDEKIKSLIDYCEENGISWVIFGDHGSPHPGAMKVNGYILPRHRKESIILSSEDLNPPNYSDEIYPWLLEIFDAEPLGHPVGESNNLTEEEKEEIGDRLENLGYKN
jgi:hypothetical protein